MICNNSLYIISDLIDEITIVNNCTSGHPISSELNPLADAIEIQSNFKNSRLVSTKGLGHGLKGKQVIENIIDFLKD